MTNLSAPFGINNITAMVADPTSSYVYFATSTGYIYKWNADTGSTVQYAHVGTDITSLALSADHTFLVAGEANATTDQPLRFDEISVSNLSSTKIQLPVATTYPADALESYRYGVYSLALTPDNQVIYNASYALSGDTPVGIFSLSDPTAVNYSGISNDLSSGWMFSSQNDRYVVVADQYYSPSDITIYDTATGITTQTPFDYLSGSAYGTVSISETDGLFAYDDGALRVLDLTDKLVHQITDFSSGGYIASATAFTPDGRYLLAWDTTNNLLRAYDTQTWAQVGSIAMPAFVSGDTAPNMVLGDNGQFLYLNGNRQSIDLGALLPIVASYDVLSGSTEIIVAGATADGVTVSSGGALEIAGLTVESGATASLESVASTATVSGATLMSGAMIDLLSATVLSGGKIRVSSGGVAIATQVLSGGEAIVQGGGASGTIVLGGGYQLVSSGGVADGTTLSGGREYVSSGGVASATTVSSGGAEVVFSTGSASGTVLSSGGEEVVSSGGVASATTILGGGKAVISSGGRGIDATVSSGGLDYVLASGTATGTVVSAGGQERVSSGGVASATKVLSGGLEYVLSGGRAVGATVSSGGLDYVLASGTATGTVVSAGGQERVSSSGVASATKVLSGGLEYVLSGGRAVGATVSSGGTETIYSGGAVNGVTVDTGGQIDDYGTVSAAALSGGLLAINGAGAASGITGFGTVIYADGATSLDAVLGGGSILYEAGPDAAFTGAAVESGATLLISGGLASGTMVRSGALEHVLAGGVAIDTTVQSDGVEFVQAAGSARGTVVSGGYQLVSSGGVASETTVLIGGRQYVSSGGHASATILSSGGAQTVFSTGSAIGTVISSGGEEVVSSGGVASTTTISNGGRDEIFSGGTASGLSLLSGGVVVDNGEVLITGAGALAGTLDGSGSVVETGGGDLLLSGAVAGFSGDAVISGGTIELGAYRALGTGSVTFVEPATGSAVLQIDAADAPAAGGTFANTIDDFSGAHEDIDLRSIAFVAGATATVVGTTLVLTDGGKTYKFNIAGSVAGAYPVLSDGHGGTLIDPQVARFAQTAAAFAPSDAAKMAGVSGTSPTAQTPFLHATASATAGRL